MVVTPLCYDLKTLHLLSNETEDRILLFIMYNSRSDISLHFFSNFRLSERGLWLCGGKKRAPLRGGKCLDKRQPLLLVFQSASLASFCYIFLQAEVFLSPSVDRNRAVAL